MCELIDARAAELATQIAAMVDRDGSAHARTGAFRADLVIEEDGHAVLYGDYPVLLQWSDVGDWGSRRKAAAECMAYAIACAECGHVPQLPAQLDH